MSKQVVDDVSAAGCTFGKNYDHEMSYKMNSNIQYLCHKCGIGNSLAKCRHLLTIAGCPLYFDTLNSWHSWHFTDTFNIFSTFLSHKALHTLDPGNPVFLKHVIITISVFPKWDHLKKIWFIMKMVSIKRITFYWNPIYMRYLNLWEIKRMQYMYISHNLSFSKHDVKVHKWKTLSRIIHWTDHKTGMSF